jgi:hypothetical protein
MNGLTLLALTTIPVLLYAAWTYRTLHRDAVAHARHLRRMTDDLTRQRDEAREQRDQALDFADDAAILAALDRHPAVVKGRHLAAVVDR